MDSEKIDKILTDANVKFENWTNQETFEIAQFLGNDEIGLGILQQLSSSPNARSMMHRAEGLETYINQVFIEVNPTLQQALIHIALGRVDWKEIIEWTRKELGVED